MIIYTHASRKDVNCTCIHVYNGFHSDIACCIMLQRSRQCNIFHIALLPGFNMEYIGWVQIYSSATKGEGKILANIVSYT